MDAIAHMPRLPYSRGLSPSAAAPQCPPPRARTTPQCSTPLWKRVIVQIAEWLIQGPRALGIMLREAFKPPAASAPKQGEKEALLLQHIAAAPTPQHGNLVEKLLLNAHIVGCLECLPDNITVPLNWLRQMPETMGVRLVARIKLLADAEMLHGPDATMRAKKLRDFCMRIQQGLPNGAQV